MRTWDFWIRRRPAARPDRRAARAWLPDAAFGPCADDDGHGARRDEARRRRSRSVSIHPRRVLLFFFFTKSPVRKKND